MKELFMVIIFCVTTWIGYKAIKNVPSLLHTPLMSGMNALSGITILGALVATAVAVDTGNKIIGVVAIVFSTINVVGGFCVTNRMLKMFRTQSEGEAK